MAKKPTKKDIKKDDKKGRYDHLISWKPGQSGNPNGRPRGTFCARTIFKKILQEEIEVKVDNKKTKMKQVEALAKRWLMECLQKGDWRAIEGFLKYSETRVDMLKVERELKEKILGEVIPVCLQFISPEDTPKFVNLIYSLNDPKLSEEDKLKMMLVETVRAIKDLQQSFQNSLPRRWTQLKEHEPQRKLWTSDKRFRIVPAGRRSGKTELAKRYGILLALTSSRDDGWFVFAAPTYNQAKRIYWDDLKKMVPAKYILANGISETELSITLFNGSKIQVLGMDKPERIEGPALDWICLDEYANCKPGIWDRHIRPALSTPDRIGSAWLIGVPEGRNHYYDLVCTAQADTTDEWEVFSWASADILDPKEIENAKATMDEITFRQEYFADFVQFAGQVYYGFDRTSHVFDDFDYDCDRELIFCFDFNRSPGVCVICQELPNYIWDRNGKKQIIRDDVSETFTAIIDEVYIPRNSVTPDVCGKLIDLYGMHPGVIRCYGDASGGAKGSAKVAGSDWDIIKKLLDNSFDSVVYHIPKANPPIISRINACNSRIKVGSGQKSLLVNRRCKHVIQDLEGVRWKEGAANVIDKSDLKLTHLTDALGYYITKEFGLNKNYVTSQEF